jgi:tRNA(Leu) C34 or U34 (ribose-2'-O)-methylase TrmL
VRCLLVELAPATPAPDQGDRLAAAIATLPPDVVVGVVALEGTVPDEVAPVAHFALPLAQMGVAATDPNLMAVAAAAAGTFVRELLVVAPAASVLHATAAGVGAASASAPDPLAADLVGLVRSVEVARTPEVGVGPHPPPWPDDPRLDPDLLAHGDRRNVVDRYRYWSEAAIVEDLATRRHGFHVAVENWQHDLNIGTVVRTANAFGAAGVHIVGQRRWNRRGAMATDRYLPVRHHPTVADLGAWAASEQLAVVGIDNVPGALDLDATSLPERVVLVFGQEGPGLSADTQEACAVVCGIRQFGSTRSLNAGVAAGIAMHAWITTHAVP